MGSKPSLILVCLILVVSSVLPLAVGLAFPAAQKEKPECNGNGDEKIKADLPMANVPSRHSDSAVSDGGFYAATHPRYIPGADDTLVPNPGYEVAFPHFPPSIGGGFP